MKLKLKKNINNENVFSCLCQKHSQKHTDYIIICKEILTDEICIIILPIQVYRQRVVGSPSQFIDDLTVLWQQLFRTTTTNCFRS